MKITQRAISKDLAWTSNVPILGDILYCVKELLYFDRKSEKKKEKLDLTNRKSYRVRTKRFQMKNVISLVCIMILNKILNHRYSFKKYRYRIKF